MDPSVDHLRFIEQAIALAVENVRTQAGGPFAALVVRNGEVISTGANCVTSTNDPTAHAEVVAIRRACGILRSFQLQGCELYSSCEPCPMCLGAIYWARPDAVYYAATHADAAVAGFDDSLIYEQIAVAPEHRLIRMIKISSERSQECFDAWLRSQSRVAY